MSPAAQNRQCEYRNGSGGCEDRVFMRRGPRLPLEVFERIIDYSNTVKGGDSPRDNDRIRRRTLHACALTCKDWVHRARFHLHHSIALYDAVEFTRFVALLHTTPAIAGYVCKLTAALRDEGNTVDNWLHMIPIQLSSLVLPKLHELSLRQCDWRNAPPVLFAHATKFDSVVTLTLQATQFNSNRELVRMLFSFVRLRSLTLRQATCAKVKPTSLPKRMRTPLPLQNLFFRRSFTAYHMFAHLHSTASSALVRTIDMDLALDATELPSVGRFLSTCIALETLVITFAIDSGDASESKPEFHEHFDFERVTCLRNFRVEFSFSAANMALLVHILSTMRSAVLDTVYVRLWTSIGQKPLGDLDGLDWAPLDAVLVSKHLSGLLQVCIQTPYRFGSSDLQTRLEGYLPLTQKKGLLVSEI